MNYGRYQFEVVMRKKYFQPTELEEVLNKGKDEIIRIACMAKALYKVENQYLVDYGKTYEFIRKNEMFYEDKDGKYITVAEAAKELGIPERVVLQVFARSSAVYKLSKYTLINLEEADRFIKQYRLDIEPIVIKGPEKERQRGSAIVREIMRNRGI